MFQHKTAKLFYQKMKATFARDYKGEAENMKIFRVTIRLASTMLTA